MPSPEAIEFIAENHFINGMYEIAFALIAGAKTMRERET